MVMLADSIRARSLEMKVSREGGEVRLMHDITHNVMIEHHMIYRDGIFGRPVLILAILGLRGGGGERREKGNA